MKIQLIRNATLKIRYAGKTILVDPMFAEKGPLFFRIHFMKFLPKLSSKTRMKSSMLKCCQLWPIFEHLQNSDYCQLEKFEAKLQHFSMISLQILLTKVNFSNS